MFDNILSNNSPLVNSFNALSDNTIANLKLHFKEFPLQLKKLKHMRLLCVESTNIYSDQAYHKLGPGLPSLSHLMSNLRFLHFRKVSGHIRKICRMLSYSNILWERIFFKLPFDFGLTLWRCLFVWFLCTFSCSDVFLAMFLYDVTHYLTVVLIMRKKSTLLHSFNKSSME